MSKKTKAKKAAPKPAPAFNANPWMAPLRPGQTMHERADEIINCNSRLMKYVRAVILCRVFASESRYRTCDRNCRSDMLVRNPDK